MLGWSQVLPFAATALAVLLFPGPSVLFVVSRGVALGRRAALATVAGNEAGTCVHVVAVAVGLGAIVQRSLIVFNLMKLVGAIYLVVLGVRAIRQRKKLLGELAVSQTKAGGARLALDGFLVGISNPKTTLFFLAVLPQFVRPGQGHVALQLLLLGLLFVAMACISDGLYGMAAGGVRKWLQRSPRRADAVGGVSGLVMIGLGVRLIMTGRKD
jgi:threonine/homoserine/homoserine lactone efflux protein